MTTRQRRMMATVDERGAHLYECVRHNGDTWHFEETDAIHNAWEDYHEKHRPSMLQRGPGTAPPHEATVGRDDEEAARRFARDVARWLERATASGNIGRLVVFASAKMLGLLRDRFDTLDRLGVHLLEGDFTALRATELARHPRIVSVLSGTA